MLLTVNTCMYNVSFKWGPTSFKLFSVEEGVGNLKHDITAQSFLSLCAYPWPEIIQDFAGVNSHHCNPRLALNSSTCITQVAISPRPRFLSFGVSLLLTVALGGSLHYKKRTDCVLRPNGGKKEKANQKKSAPFSCTRSELPYTTFGLCGTHLW